MSGTIASAGTGLLQWVGQRVIIDVHPDQHGLSTYSDVVLKGYDVFGIMIADDDVGQIMIPWTAVLEIRLHVVAEAEPLKAV